MTWWRMTPGVKKHQSIKPGETVIHACYGLSATLVAIANIAVGSSLGAKRASSTWNDEFSDDATGMATVINRTGVLALTDQRVIFFAKRFAIGRPKTILNDWPLGQVSAISYDPSDAVLKINFVDGTEAGMHVPSSQSPAELVDGFAKLVSAKTSA